MAQDRVITLDSPDIPILPDDYIGTAYGNMLDSYDSVTYNLRLYMISPFGNNLGGTVQADQRSDSGSVTSPTGATAPPSQTIVIAQTGVTQTIIDNLELTTVGGLHMATEVSFELIQPNKANLLDQMLIAKNQLGIKGKRLPPLYLEVSFLGRTVDHSSATDANEQQGQVVRVTQPFRYELVIRDIQASMDESGGRFQFSTVVKNTEAYANNRFRLRESLTIQGNTISEMLNDLSAKLTDQHYDSSYEEVDVFVFDLSNLVASGANPGNDPGGSAVLSPLIQNEGLLVPTISEQTDTRNEASTEFQDSSTIYRGALEYIRGNVVSSEGGAKNQLRLREGVSIQDIILTVLSMNREFLASVHRAASTDPAEPTPEENRSRAFVKWVKTNATVEYLGFDRVRNDYARKFTYRPYFYNTARTDVYVKSDENRELRPQEIANRLSTMIQSQCILKSYHYLFTGRNDQIKDLDLTFNAAQTVLIAKDRGYSGNLQTAARDILAANLPENTDVSREGQTAESSTSSGTSISSQADVNNTLNLFEGLSQRAGDATEEVAGAIADFLGEDPGTVANILRNGTEEQRTSLAIRTAPFLNANPQTFTQTGTTGVEDTYVPESSGFRYSDDFLALAPGQVLDLDQLEKQEFLYRTAQQAAQDLKISHSTEADYVPNKAEGATTETGKNTNMIFGQLINQHENNRFMLTLDMTIRGDPWYLGRDPRFFRSNFLASNPTSTATEVSQPEAAYFGRDDQYLVFTVASPPPRDIDISDEDANTGYWMKSGVNYTFTGIYQIIGATHNFSSGEYTTQVNAVRIVELDVTSLPPNWQETLKSLNVLIQQ